MVVTAKTKDGKSVGSIERNYHPQGSTCRDEKMAYGAQNKSSYIRDTSLQPFQTKAESFEFDLPLDDKGAPAIRTVDVTVELIYEIQSPDNKFTITKFAREVTLDR